MANPGHHRPHLDPLRRSSDSGPGGGTRPEVDRTERAAYGTHTLVFGNQPEATGFNIVIGYDGA